jgi:hypothetical protein
VNLDAHPDLGEGVDLVGGPGFERDAAAGGTVAPGEDVAVGVE